MPSRSVNRPDRRAPTGFTLIEIMIVMGFIVLIMATGLPAFTRHSRRESLVQAASDVSDACRAARREAILKGTTMEVSFRAEDSHIAVRPSPKTNSRAPADGIRSALLNAADAATGEIAGYTLSEEVRFLELVVNGVDVIKLGKEAKAVRARFFPNGTCDELSVLLLSDRGGRYRVSLEVVTALPTMEEVR